jgi:hypothetical protein
VRGRKGLRESLRWRPRGRKGERVSESENLRDDGGVRIRHRREGAG